VCACDGWAMGTNGASQPVSWPVAFACQLITLEVGGVWRHQRPYSVRVEDKGAFARRTNGWELGMDHPLDASYGVRSRLSVGGVSGFILKHQL
jgi:hypothetical protein